MATVSEHYSAVLADVYSWMLGGFEEALARNTALFERLNVRTGGSGHALDLGAGCGFQSIPLARAGFQVTAIDIDATLITELKENDDTGRINAVVGDLLNFTDHIEMQPELAVCMTDTVLHLEKIEQIEQLFRRLHATLERNGRFIATFRDLSKPLHDLDRFIPVRSDDSNILTCFLEREGDRLRVHDLLWRRTDDGWEFSKSFYNKLIVTPEQAGELLRSAGFSSVETTVVAGLVTIDAVS